MTTNWRDKPRQSKYDTEEIETVADLFAKPARKREDLTGRTFGRLTAVVVVGLDDKYSALWLCNCECGRSKIVSGMDLLYGRVKSCGHHRGKVKDKTGMKFGKLTVVGIDKGKHSGKNVMWLCKCECGNTVSVSSSHLNDSSPIKSCGCFKRERMVQFNKETT